MDIEEMKKYSQNKIEADNLIKQVRQKIKENTWEKQNLREGFTETFKPLISQFEKPDDPKAQNIFTQNQKMLQNQLALTEGTTNNLLALQGIKNEQERLNKILEYIENKANFDELPGLEAIEDGKDNQARAPTPTPFPSTTPTPFPSTTPTPTSSPTSSPTPTPTPLVQKTMIELDKTYFDRYLMNKRNQEILAENAFDKLPSFYFDKDKREIDNLIDNVKSDLNGLFSQLQNKTKIETNDKGYLEAESTALIRGPNPETKKQIINFNVLSIYMKNLVDLSNLKSKQSGSGLFNTPQQLLRRFELLNGSLVAGNNGVLPEFIQLAHQLRDLGILTNKQLNALLRKVI